MGERQDLQQAFVAGPLQQLGKVASQGGLHHWIRRKVRLPGNARTEFVYGKCCLKGKRMLRPEGAVIVENSDAFRRRQEV